MAQVTGYPSVAESTLYKIDTAKNYTPDNSDHEFIIDTNQLGQLIIKDSPIISALDSLVNIKYFKDHPFTTDTSILNTNGFNPFDVPVYPDSIYQQRIEKLNHETPMDLVFNRQVKNFIHLYAVKKRELTSKVLGLSELYFPMFEEQLDKYDLPLELKYLAVVESALNPTAGSRAGAKGIWQFMYGTGKVYGLKVTSYIDYRYDPYKATIAACEHLQDLYNIYDNWSLAMAAYNSGAGNVNKAIRRAGGVKSYWAIWPFLPRETRGYVPAFIAVTYVMNYAAEHNLYPLDPGILYNGIDSVTVKDVLSFDQLNEMLGIPMEDLKFLNPSFKKGVLPVTKEKQYSLWLPKTYIGDFINNEKELYAYKTSKGVEKDKLLAQIKKAQERTVHVVRSGENLGLIAKRYHVYISQLKAWNGLRGSTIYPGQRLIVYPSAKYDPRKYQQKTASTKKSTKGLDKQTHTVKYGENLGLIANKYNCSVSDLKSWNNLRGNTIQPNQKLIVYKPKEQTTAQETGGDKKYLYHTIRPGDTLWDIAKLYDGVTVSQIKKLNNISNARKLKPGQKIKVAVLNT
jgi:membrane-bound lytic murein transglycosylase D